MKTYAASDIRNVSLISHGGHGTTSLGEAILFDTKATTRLGSVDAGNSVLDFEPEELERKSSITAGIASAEYKGKRLNLLDVPGSADFVGDTTNALNVCDGVVCVVSAPDGVEVRTEALWQRAARRELPTAVFINKMDRERADFDRCLEEIRRDLSPSVTPITIPIGKEGSFRGVVDLLSNRALLYSNDGSGSFQAQDVPADLADRVSELREKLVEEIAGSDEELMEKYFDEGDLGPNDLFKGLAKGIRAGLIYPAFAGSATQNIGVQPLLDLIVQTFPGADEVPPAQSADGKSQREPKPDVPFSAFVFKTIADQFAGQLSVFRVVSGTIHSDGTFLNATQGEKERFGAIVAIHGREQKPVEQAGPGDIVAVAKLKTTHTGDTLCDEAHAIVYAPQAPPRPVATFAVKPKKKGEEEKIFSGLARLREEDPSLHIERDPNSGETLLSGMGQVHIEVTLKKLLRKFKVEAELELPRIAYRETIKGKADNVTYRHKKQTGGRGQFGECTIALTPLPRGGGFEFEDGVVGGAIPRQYIPAVEKGVHERMVEGVVAGYPVVDVKVRLFDGKFHAVDSSEMAFKIAGRMAFKKAFEQAKPILLEPIWGMTITIPNENVGDIMGDISGRRGKVLGMEDQGKYTLVKAQVPLSEVQTYSSDLRSMTSGRGTFEMAFDHYEEMPNELAHKITAAYVAHEED
jgi:elongation factor G